LDGVLRQPHPNQIEAGVFMVHGYGGNFYSGIMNFLPEALKKICKTLPQAWMR
jgi:hypothetical protein